MWRKKAEGEGKSVPVALRIYLTPVLLLAYSYMLTTNDLCSENDIICNSDFGVSIDRGSFSFQAGEFVLFTIFCCIGLIFTPDGIE